jgi:transposase
MVSQWSFEVRAVIRKAASRLTGFKRRLFVAEMAIEYCQASPRQTESILGFKRRTVARGLQELELGKPIRTLPENRGRPRIEQQQPDVVSFSDAVLSENSQVDPKFQTTLAFTRVTGNELREALATSLNVAISSLPVPRSLRRLINRRGYSLRKVRKTKPLKKIPETNEIFDNIQAAHQRAATDQSILRISIDDKAKVKIGEFSRGGFTRRACDQNAADHDMGHGEKLVPSGILEIESGQLTIGFAMNTSTSDAIADNLELCWNERKVLYPHIRTLMIDLDNGPKVASRRTQFMKRLVSFADKHKLAIELVYYPPYHSKYNAVERCWGVLEQHWNGTLLTSISTTLNWARSMTWKKIHPIVRLLDGIYRQYLSKRSQADQRRIRVYLRAFTEVAGTW